MIELKNDYATVVLAAQVKGLLYYQEGAIEAVIAPT